MFPFSWQQHSEDAALTRHTFHLDLTAMRFDDVFDYRQAKPGPAAAVVGGTRFVGPVKTLEDMRQICCGNADSRVTYFQRNLLIAPVGFKQDRAAFRRVMDGITQQILDNARESVHVKL